MAPVDAKLRKNVEKLMDALRRRVLENDDLLAQLTHRDEVVQRVELVLQLLDMELREGLASPERAKPLARYVGNLLLTAAVAYSSTRAAERPAPTPSKPPRTLVEVEGHVGDDVRVVLGACNVIVHVSAAATSAVPRRDKNAPRAGRLAGNLLDYMEDYDLSRAEVARMLRVSADRIEAWQRGTLPNAAEEDAIDYLLTDLAFKTPKARLSE